MTVVHTSTFWKYELRSTVIPCTNPATSLMQACNRKGTYRHTGKTGAGSDSGAGYNVNKWVFSLAADLAELACRT
jgi:hypothetical protein